MENREIRSFLAVAQMGSVTLAAAQLHLTQPAVTQHIHGVERALGRELFERSRRGMRLTKAGEAARWRLRDAMHLLDALRADLSAGEAEIRGEVVLGSALALTGGGLAAALHGFVTRHPQTRLSLRTGRSEEVCSWVVAGEVELGLTGWLPRQARLKGTPLFTQKFVLVAPPGHPLAGRTVRRLALGKLTMVHNSRGQWLGVDWSAAFASAARSRIESDTLDSIRSLVCAGAGCAVLPEEDVRAELERGALARITVQGLPPIARTVYIIEQRNRHLEAHARLLRSELQRAFVEEAIGS